MKKSVLILVSLLALVVTMAACGEDEETAAVAEPTAVTAGTEAVKATPTETMSAEAMAKEKMAEGMMTYSESPEVAKLVAAGSLPAVEERLPDNPMVVPVFEEIGTYGGTWRFAYAARTDRAVQASRTSAGLISLDPDQVTIIPAVAESWEISDDGRVFTFHLRQGHKWYDGTPFTTEDVKFWWDDTILNDELWPVKPSKYRTKGELGKMDVIDDTTFKWTFVDNFRLFEEYIGMRSYGELAYLPKHYMQQFHPKYAGQAEADKLAKDAGFDKWTQLFEMKHDRRNTMSGAPGIPTLFPWQPKTKGGEQQMILERNPYYYGVDPEGNQLPYIEKIVAELVEDIDVLTLRTIAGDFDHQPRQLRMDSVPTLQKNTEKGDYRVLFWPGASGSDAGVHFNQSYQADPAIGDLLRNKEFRRALSHAIDRDKILQLVFLGVGESRQMVVPRENPYYPGDDYAFKYTDFDPPAAAKMLDAILPKKNAEGFRTFDDGTVVELQFTPVELFGTFWPQTAELVAEMWQDVGVKTEVIQMERSAWVAKRNANETQVNIWDAGNQEHLFTGRHRTMAFNSGSMIGPLHGQWYATGGEKGLKPEGDLFKVAGLHDQGDSATLEERYEIGKEIFRINVDNLWTIGTVGNTPTIFGLVVTKNNMRNVPDGMPHQWAYTFRPEQRFFKK